MEVGDFCFIAGPHRESSIQSDGSGPFINVVVHCSMRRVLCSLSVIVLCAAAVHAQSIFDNVSYQNGARSHRFDLLHVAIDVRFDMPRRLVIGTVEHRMRSLDTKLGSISINAGTGMVFKRIVVDGVAAQHQHNGDTLDITLPAARRYGDTFTVAIDYEISPRKGLYFIQPDSLVPTRRSQIWTQGEAEDHRYWVPLYDYPNDRATTEVRATIPSSWKLLSNGRHVSTTPGAEPGTAVWHYRQERPHSTYLIMLAAGDYLVTRDTAAGVPLEYWSYPDMPARVEPTFGRTPDMMRYLVDMLGPYPWDKYAQVMIADYMYGGMENTTATTLNDYALVDRRGLIDYNPDGLIAHEIAHQWFGDMVTNRSWGHLWIHESYATYLAARYEGHRYGEDAFIKRIYDNGNIGVRSEVTRGRDPLASGNGVTANIYQRGSRVLHMLNQLVGEELFQRANRHFLERHAYGLVETNDLKLAFEDATGLNLGWFFDQWIYGAGHPQLNVEKNWKGNTLSLTVTQTQQRDSLTGLFAMPVPLEFHLKGRVVVVDTVWVSEQAQTFTFELPEEPKFVIFDAGDALLKTVTYPRPARELIAQVDAPRMIDRFHAVNDLLSRDAGLMVNARDRAASSEAVQAAFERERSEYVREAILDNITMLDTSAAVAIIRRGFGDPVADVRQAAVEKSFMITSTASRASLLRPMLTDSSYNVIAAALGMLAVTDTTGLEPALRSMKGMRGRRDRIAVSWLNAVLAGRYKSMADDVADYTIPPYGTDTRVQAFYVLTKLEATTPHVRTAVERGLREPSSRLRGAAASAARSHLDNDMRAMLQSLRESSSDDVRETIDEVLRGR